MNFVVWGTGGVGGFFGGMLARHGQKVWFVARGKHLAAMKEGGLRVNSPSENFTIPPGKMTDDAAEVGPADVVLFCVKSYDTESAAQQLSPVLTSRTFIISLQNGIDNEERIQRVVPAGTVLGGVAYIYSTITAPGEITESGGPRKIILGAMPGAGKEVREGASEIRDVLSEAGINAGLSDDISLELWKKFIFIAAVGGLTALTRLTLGEMLAVPEARALLRNAMEEVQRVAAAKGVSVGSGYVDTLFENLRRYDNHTRSSLYYDLVHGKPLEIEALSGTVITYGHALRIPVPIHETIYGALLPYHLKQRTMDT
jgi:2-dehydropantoate 2-reductase